MTENKHTPGPWSWNTDYNEDNVFSVWVEAPDVTHKTTNICVADCSWVELLEEAEANAEFIVRACNTHDELLAALEDVTYDLEAYVNAQYLENGKVYHPAMQSRYDRDIEPVLNAKVVIAKARGEQ